MTSKITPTFPAEFERACRISKEQKVEYYGKLLVPGGDTATCEQEFA